AQAIDKEDIIDIMLEGKAVAADTLLSPAVFGHSEDIERIEYNVEESKALLEENGYEDGFSAEITVQDRTAADIATYIQEQLQDPTIEREIYQIDPGAYTDYVGSGSHDLLLGGWGTVTLDADYGPYPLFHSSSGRDSGTRS